ncbi:MAG: IDEAL domain-containing protein [Firmicutes bacterium]|nr:IDEAL domain-containing protein [Bacillota bacterium]
MTKKTVSIWAKKNFIYWFLENYRFANDIPAYILQELAQTEELLSRLKLVVNGACLRPLIVIATDGIGLPPLLYLGRDQNQTEPQSIIESLYSNEESPIYLTLYFPDRSTSEPYLTVVEETKELNQNQNNHLLIDFELSLWSQGFKREQERAAILKQIDQALAEGKKRQFRRLVKKLKEL